jgi:hypothetical protein
MHKNAPPLVKLGLYECYGRDEMLEDISLLHVVQRYLALENGLPIL